MGGGVELIVSRCLFICDDELVNRGSHEEEEGERENRCLRGDILLQSARSCECLHTLISLYCSSMAAAQSATLAACTTIYMKNTLKTDSTNCTLSFSRDNIHTPLGLFSLDTYYYAPMCFFYATHP